MLHFVKERDKGEKKNQKKRREKKREADASIFGARRRRACGRCEYKTLRLCAKLNSVWFDNLLSRVASQFIVRNDVQLASDFMGMSDIENNHRNEDEQ
jgi:hypothetical protein